MPVNDWNNLGRDVKDIVQHAINSGDFSALNRDLGATLDSALGNVAQSMKRAGNAYSNKYSYKPFGGYRNPSQRERMKEAREEFALFVNTNGAKALGLLFTTLGIINLIFLISNKFLGKKYSFAITLFFIASSVLSANVFNCFFPYSYGMIYGLFFILGSLYAALNKQFILAYALYSFSICSKYEFILLLPLLIAVSWKNKSWKYIAALIMPAVITYLPLIIQKAGLNNLIISYQLILSMSATKTLYWFYSMTGLVFRPELIPIYLENFFKAAIPVAILYFINSYFILPFIFQQCIERYSQQRKPQ